MASHACLKSEFTEDEKSHNLMRWLNYARCFGECFMKRFCLCAQTMRIWRYVCLSECVLRIEPPHDKTNKMACAPSEDLDQPGHLPSLIRVFAVRMKKAWVLSYPLSAQRRLWSDWADAQADLSLCWAQSFCWLCHEAANFMHTHYNAARRQTTIV